jgi:hypothetical protein
MIGCRPTAATSPNKRRRRDETSRRARHNNTAQRTAILEDACASFFIHHCAPSSSTPCCLRHLPPAPLPLPQPSPPSLLPWSSAAPRRICAPTSQQHHHHHHHHPAIAATDTRRPRPHAQQAHRKNRGVNLLPLFLRADTAPARPSVDKRPRGYRPSQSPQLAVTLVQPQPSGLHRPFLATIHQAGYKRPSATALACPSLRQGSASTPRSRLRDQLPHRRIYQHGKRRDRNWRPRGCACRRRDCDTSFDLPARVEDASDRNTQAQPVGVWHQRPRPACRRSRSLASHQSAGAAGAGRPCKRANADRKPKQKASAHLRRQVSIQCCASNREHGTDRLAGSSRTAQARTSRPASICCTTTGRQRLLQERAVRLTTSCTFRKVSSTINIYMGPH